MICVNRQWKPCPVKMKIEYMNVYSPWIIGCFKREMNLIVYPRIPKDPSEQPPILAGAVTLP
jgi:hypothetical protein